MVNYDTFYPQFVFNKMKTVIDHYYCYNKQRYVEESAITIRSIFYNTNNFKYNLHYHK